MKHWKFTPVHNKEPFVMDWQHNYMPLDEALNYGQILSPTGERDMKANGIGLVLGVPSNGVMALDFDGTEAWDFFQSQFGSLADYEVGLAWTSGKADRVQVAWQVPQQHWETLRTRRVSPNRKLEFRWTGGQSVLPPSVHPETGSYEWVVADELLPMPERLLNFWLDIEKPKTIEDGNYQAVIPQDNMEELIIGLMEIIKSYNFKVSYIDWLEIGFAVAKEVGIPTAKNIMKAYYPEQHAGEYNMLFGSSYKVMESPGVGALINRAIKADKSKTVELLEKTTPAVEKFKRKLSWRYKQQIIKG